MVAGVLVHGSSTVRADIGLLNALGVLSLDYGLAYWAYNVRHFNSPILF